MKSVKGLRNPDIVEINGEKFQVIENTSSTYDTEKEELVMEVTLVKVGEKQVTPKYLLTYVYERPSELRFFIFDKKSKDFKEQKIKSVKF